MKYPKTVIVGFCTLALFIGAPLAAVHAQGDSAEHTKKGIEFAKKKQYAEAAQEFSAAIKADPKDSKHYLNRANAYRAAGKLQEAAADFTKYGELEPDRADGFSGRGKVKVSQKDYDGAIEDLTKALEMDDDVDTYRFRAFAYISKNDYEKAIEDYTKVLDKKSTDPQALERRAFAYRNLKQYDKAIEDLTKLLEGNEKDAEAYRARGYAYSLTDDNAKAEADFNKVLKLKPGDADAQTRLKAVQAKAAGGAGVKPAAGAAPAAAPSPSH